MLPYGRTGRLRYTDLMRTHLTRGAGSTFHNISPVIRCQVDRRLLSIRHYYMPLTVPATFRKVVPTTRPSKQLGVLTGPSSAFSQVHQYGNLSGARHGACLPTVSCIPTPVDQLHMIKNEDTSLLRTFTPLRMVVSSSGSVWTRPTEDTIPNEGFGIFG
jgi:hypothetical protein